MTYYPRPGATSVLQETPALPRIPKRPQETVVAVLDRVADWDPDGTEEDILATCHTLAPFAIPHRVTTSTDDALGFPIVAVAGTPTAIPKREANRLARYVEDGGILLLWRPSPSLLDLLGMEETGGGGARVIRPVSFSEDPAADPMLLYIDKAVEQSWQLTLPSYAHSSCYALAGSAGRVLARWATDADCVDASDVPLAAQAAVVRIDAGSGTAYVFGWRLRHILGTAERLLVPGDEPSWTNEPVPDADIARLLTRGIYEGHSPVPTLRQYAPEGHRAALIVTHDVDSINSYGRVAEFASWEAARGIHSTYLLTTLPYASGWPDYGEMYTPVARDAVRAAIALGHDIQSHTFGHFPDFQNAPLGTGLETAATYAPYYDSVAAVTRGMSVIGEAGVSRWLLENDFQESALRVEGFRSGHLEIPSALFTGLEQTGYRRDSTFPAGLTRGAFPYPGYTWTGQSFRVSRILEYPLAISDHGLSQDTVTDTVDAWMRVLAVNYANQAPTVLLLHTSSRDGKLEAMQLLLDRVASEGLDLWVGDWATFGRFWESQGVVCDRWP